MSWTKLDDRFPRHPKVAPRSDRAFRLHVHAKCNANEFNTDGLVPDPYALGLKATTTQIAAAVEELVTARLWERDERGQFWIHDFLKYNPSKDEVEDQRQRANDRVTRWRDRKRNGVTEAFAKRGCNAAPDPTRPDPDLPSSLRSDGFTPVVSTPGGFTPVPDGRPPTDAAEADMARVVPDLVEAPPKRKARPKTDADKPPLPFTVGAALDAVKAAAGERFEFDPKLLGPGIASGITNLIRKGVTLDEFAVFGEWLASGGSWVKGPLGPSWLTSGRFGDDLAAAKAWKARGRTELARAPARRVTEPAAKAADFEGGPDEF